MSIYQKKNNIISWYHKQNIHSFVGYQNRYFNLRERYHLSYTVYIFIIGSTFSEKYLKLTSTVTKQIVKFAVPHRTVKVPQSPRQFLHISRTLLLPNKLISAGDCRAIFSISAKRKIPGLKKSEMRKNISTLKLIIYAPTSVIEN